MLYRITFSLFLLLLSLPAFAVNHVYLDIVESGEDKGADTLFVGKDYEARVFLRNDIHLGEMRLAFRFWGGIVGKDGSRAGHFWEWTNVEGYGPTYACVSIAPGSRMDPVGSVWDDMFSIFEWHMNEDSPDTIGIRGVASTGGLPVGLSEHMISIHFTPKMPTYGMITMWADTAFVPTTGALTFYDMVGTIYNPSFTTPGWWPIAIVCGDANSDGTVNIGDAVFLINFIFSAGASPQPLQAGDANCDGGTNVGDAVYIVNYIFNGGAEPCCPSL